jgi:zinc and cadmium transporter
LGGILIFFILEKFLRWQHCHIPASKDHVHPVVTLNIVGDSFHNMIDGMLIAASFLASIPIGITTTIAVILHEIPQEMGHFGILVHGGVPVKRALMLNFLSALSSFIGAFIVLLIGTHAAAYSVYLLPITAGGFLYNFIMDMR